MGQSIINTCEKGKKYWPFSFPRTLLSRQEGEGKWHWTESWGLTQVHSLSCAWLVQDIAYFSLNSNPFW